MLGCSTSERISDVSMEFLAVNHTHFLSQSIKLPWSQTLFPKNTMATVKKKNKKTLKQFTMSMKCLVSVLSIQDNVAFKAGIQEHRRI